MLIDVERVLIFRNLGDYGLLMASLGRCSGKFPVFDRPERMLTHWKTQLWEVGY